jgi:DTW domain-containing protein
MERDLCRVCNRSVETCFCKFATPFMTRTRFVILMHPREFKRQRTGTGRVARHALINSEIIVGAEFENHPRVNAVLRDSTQWPMLLYPGATSISISDAPMQTETVNRGLTIFLLDATWASARKMLRLSPNLQKLPRVTFASGQLSRFVIKRQPATYALSTIEAIFRLLEGLEGQGYERLTGQHQTLMETLDSIVAFQLECAANPKLPSHRIPAPVKERAP